MGTWLGFIGCPNIVSATVNNSKKDIPDAPIWSVPESRNNKRIANSLVVSEYNFLWYLNGQVTKIP
jgi:hypothetical protein